jgi:phosphoribosylanthranilate isomerase
MTDPERNTKVKICGLTNIEDAISAVKAGADLLGFIFYPASKRSIKREDALQIVSEIRSGSVTPLLVGVFVNENVDIIAQTLNYCHLDLAQLSGDEIPALIGDVSSPIYSRSYKAIRPTSISEAEAESEWYLPPEPVENHPTLLVDTYHPKLHGGTGQTGNWELASRVARTTNGLMLAGGLNPLNVGNAIHSVKPYAVDVASGVENSPGKKDHNMVRAFVKAAKSVQIAI